MQGHVVRKQKKLETETNLQANPHRTYVYGIPDVSIYKYTFA